MFSLDNGTPWSRKAAGISVFTSAFQAAGRENEEQSNSSFRSFLESQPNNSLKPKSQNLITWPHLATKAYVLPFSRIDLHIHIHTLLLSTKEHPVTSRQTHHTFVLLLYLICIWYVNIYIYIYAHTHTHTHTHTHLLPPLPAGIY